MILFTELDIPYNEAIESELVVWEKMSFKKILRQGDYLVWKTAYYKVLCMIVMISAYTNFLNPSPTLMRVLNHIPADLIQMISGLTKTHHHYLLIKSSQPVWDLPISDWLFWLSWKYGVCWKSMFSSFNFSFVFCGDNRILLIAIAMHP